MATPCYSAVVFDMDGVLIDTHQCAYRMLSESARTYGIDISADEISSWGSLSGEQFWNRIKTDYHLEATIDELVSGYDLDAEIRQYKAIGLINGVAPLIDRIYHTGNAIGLATSAKTIRIEAVLSLGDLEGRFSSIISADDVENHKPDPECYIESCQRLSVAPSRTLVIEDSSNGALAAKRAGCDVAAFHGSMWPHDPFEADYHIESFTHESGSILSLLCD